MMKTLFYFNTGVRPTENPNLFGNQVWRGGVKQTPFECENVPEEARFIMACDYPDLPESKNTNVIVARVLPGSDMLSKYAYFTIPTSKTR